MEDIRFHGDNLVRLEDVVCKINSGESGDEILVIDTEMCDIHPEFPIRFDALVIVLIKRVEGYVDVNLQRYDLSPGSLLVLTPKDYISGFSTSNDGCGTVMMCSHNIVETLFPKIRDLLPLLINHVEQSVLNLNSEEYEMLSDLMSIMKRQLAERDGILRKQKALSLMQNILYEILGLRHKATSIRKEGSTRKDEIMSKFLKLVSANFMTCRTVQYYAEELCVTPKHLTTTVKEVSSKTAREWIDDFVIMEAKQLLRVSPLTIQEISDRLHFANQSFFGKYYKNLTGESTSDYRRKVRG